jgi:hypothetical protein
MRFLLVQDKQAISELVWMAKSAPRLWKIDDKD